MTSLLTAGTRTCSLVLWSLAVACSSTDGTASAGSPRDASEAGGGGDGDGDGGVHDGSPGVDGALPDGTCATPPADTFDPAASYVAPAQAATIVVSNVSDSGPGSLRSAVGKGGVVAFDAALAGKTITLSSTIELSTSVTIDGSAARGLTIDAAQKGGAFHFNGDSATKLRFFALRIINGKTAGSGGAISINGGAVEVEVAGVQFESNVAGEGGAIRVGYRNPIVSIHDSTFLNNDGSIANNGFSGGAITVSGGHLHVARCRFEANIGITSGAVYGIHANPVVEDSVFVSNRSAGVKGSGAFFADGGGPGDYNNGDKTPGEITLRRSLFQKNRGAGDDAGGGELYAYPADAVTVEGCIFRENQSNPGRAGALFIHSDNTVDVKRTAFIANQATGAGGAIWADGSAVYTFENDLFSANVAQSDLGGALRMELADKGKLRIFSATFVENVARGGNGAMWLPGVRDVHVANSIFSGNTANGGSQQINFPVSDDGGNIEWPDPKQKSTLPSSRIVDPLLGPLALESGTWVRPLLDKSPAIDAATVPSPTVDQRGALRDSKPDVGSYEVGAMCGAR